MIRRVLSILWQTVLLFAAAFAGFLTGMLRPDLRVYRLVSRTATNIRTYDFNWVIAAALVYAVLLLVATFRKRIHASWVNTTIALVITVAVILLFTQFGVKNTPVGYAY